ncbi:MAG: glycosyltransferase family 4 protein [Oscillatoriales cyanobacterium RM2_1_1]|nr:glycosyltransferase family 4 protein [Oscillatoriales cyanobacterium SM2_3_0]NJO46146.1 glycosyltransferase family 4 protein [Oscillatoriales cyanobacterium RM2_1_1]
MISHPLRVLFLASYFPKPDNPLMGTWALEQAKALVRQDIDLKVISLTSWVPRAFAVTTGAKAYANCPIEYDWIDGVKVDYPRWLYYPISPIKLWMHSHPISYLKIAYKSVEKSLLESIESFSPDLIFCHHTLPNGWMAAQLAQKFCRPLITFDHDYDEIVDCRKYPQRKSAVLSVTQKAWAMLSVSQRMERDMQSIFPNIRRTLTHHIGVNLPSDDLIRHPRPAEIKDKVIILSCALFSERKGIPLLIEAFCSIADKHPNAILRIIGSGPDEENIKATAAQCDQNYQVQLLGKKPHSEVLQEMSWADCFALVSWDEPLGAVYLEAMAAAKPVICCNDGGINDIIENNIHGYTVAPKDLSTTIEALEKMLSNCNKRLEMGKNSKQLIVKKMCWDAKATELINLFEEALY